TKQKLTENDDAELVELARIVNETTKQIEAHRLDLAQDTTYHFVWNKFADVYIEKVKPILKSGTEEEKRSAEWTLYHILTTSLALLHPFMPFITEEIWSFMPHKEKKLLMVSKWPQ
ncbi:MAG: class I tRNA ligase family protein, partial [Parcubacteria group bacterium]|nr:class I tRNA ligase family protein [Parcubacteria group bacterium]